MVKGSFLGANSNNNSCWLQLTFILAVISFFSVTDTVKGKFRYVSSLLGAIALAIG